MSIRVCYPFVGDSVGGAQISGLLLAERIRAEGYDPLVVVHQKGALSAFLDSRNVPYVVLPMKRLAGASPGVLAIAADMGSVFWPIYRFLKRERVSIVHGNDLRTNLSWVFPARAAGASHVWHQRTMPNSRSMIWNAVPWLSSKGIAISKAVGRALRLPDTDVVYNPFEFAGGLPSRSLARDDLCKRFSLRDDALIIGFVGRLVSYKRPDVCVDCVSVLKATAGRDVHCIFVGHATDQERSALERLSKARAVDGHIHFFGFSQSVEIQILGFDCLVAPSETEGFGRTLVEAVVAGTPVVASNIEAHREIAELIGSVRLAAVGDSQSFSDAIVRAASPSRDSEQALRRSADICHQIFSTDRHVSRIQQIYAKLDHARDAID